MRLKGRLALHCHGSRKFAVCHNASVRVVQCLENEYCRVLTSFWIHLSRCKYNNFVCAADESTSDVLTYQKDRRKSYRMAKQGLINLTMSTFTVHSHLTWVMLLHKMLTRKLVLYIQCTFELCLFDWPFTRTLPHIGSFKHRMTSSTCKDLAMGTSTVPSL